MQKGRDAGLKIGVLQIVTLWPAPGAEIEEVMNSAKAVFVPELNLGQYISEVQKRNPRNIPVIGVNKTNSKPIFPAEILEKIKEVAD